MYSNRQVYVVSFGFIPISSKRNDLILSRTCMSHHLSTTAHLNYLIYSVGSWNQHQVKRQKWATIEPDRSLNTALQFSFLKRSCKQMVIWILVLPSWLNFSGFFALQLIQTNHLHYWKDSSYLLLKTNGKNTICF